MRRPSPPKLLKTISMLLPCVRSAAFSRQAGVTAVPLARRAHVHSRGGAATTTTAVRAAASADLPLFYNDVYRVALPEGHRFPMEKYRLVREVKERAGKTAMTPKGGLRQVPTEVGGFLEESRRGQALLANGSIQVQGFMYRG